jgi:hypothetical protein
VQHQRQRRAGHVRGHVGRRGERGHLGEPRAPRLLGGLARRRLPLGERLRGPVATPDRDRPRCGPGHDAGDADLGEELDRQLAAVALGECLDDHQLRHGPRDRRDRAHHDVEPRLARRGHLALGHLTGAVGQHHRLAHREAAYDDRVVRLGALDRDRRARVDARERRHQVDVQRHRRRVSAG